MKNALIFCGMASAIILTGCATTQTIKPTDCASADWRQIGIADGQMGASSQKIIQHQKVCQGQHAPNREAWEAGRQEGLKAYCTPNNAYNLGRRGYSLNGVCDDNIKNLEELHRANLMGLQQYEMSERINHLDYGYSYGGFFHPWLMPYHPRWW